MVGSKNYSKITRTQWTTEQEIILVEFIHKEALNGTAKHGSKQVEWTDEFWDVAAKLFLDDDTRSAFMCQKKHYRLRYMFRDVRKILKSSKGFNWDDQTAKVVTIQDEWDKLGNVDRLLSQYDKRHYLWYWRYEDNMSIIGDRFAEPKSGERLAAGTDDEDFTAGTVESDNNTESLFDGTGEPVSADGEESDDSDSEDDSDSLFVSQAEPKSPATVHKRISPFSISPNERIVQPRVSLLARKREEASDTSEHQQRRRGC